MDEQTDQQSFEYAPPMLVEVGEFAEDTLGFGSGYDNTDGVW